MGALESETSSDQDQGKRLVQTWNRIRTSPDQILRFPPFLFSFFEFKLENRAELLKVHFWIFPVLIVPAASCPQDGNHGNSDGGRQISSSMTSREETAEVSGKHPPSPHVRPLAGEKSKRAPPPGSFNGPQRWGRTCIKQDRVWTGCMTSSTQKTSHRAARGEQSRSTREV